MTRPDQLPNLERFRAPSKVPAGAPPKRSGIERPPGDSTSIVERERRTRRIHQELQEIPTLPDVVWKVMALAGDANSRASDFEAIIQKDQALAGKVLKLVNSSFFGLRQKVTSISQAVVLLGFKTIKSVVIAAKTSYLLNRQLAPYGFHAGGMWAHSISCATACHFVARRVPLDRDAREELFLAGLMHDVGKVVMAPHLTPVASQLRVALERHGDVVLAEKEIVGISHDVLGGTIAEGWNLSPSLAELMRRHHEAEASGPDVRALRVLQVANDLCHQLGIGRAQGPREPSPFFAQWLGELGLSGDVTIADDLEQWLGELQGVFESLGTDPVSGR